MIAQAETTVARHEVCADGAVTINDAQKLLPVSRVRLYELMNDGSLPYTMVGSRRLIPRRAIVDLLAKGLVMVG